MTTRVVLSPFARIDGDLRVELDVADGVVANARVVETFYRGFERMLRGRESRDGMVLTPRVCGQCSLAHASAAALALRALSGVEVPANGYLAVSVMLGVETLATHLGHLYLSLAPTLAPLLPGRAALARFVPTAGRSFVGAVAARRALLPILGLFAGKWPNSLAVQPGGTSKSLDRSEIARSLAAMADFKLFVEDQLLGGDLGEWLAIASDADLAAWATAQRHRDSDLGLFVAASLELGLDRIGRGPGSFLSCGGWETAAGRYWLEPGYLALEPGREREPFDAERIDEQSMQPLPEVSSMSSQPPSPLPRDVADEAYSWGKAPRYAGAPAETGPLARLLCAGDPLIADVVARRGPSAHARALARLRELVRLAAQLETWIDGIDVAQPFCERTQIPEAGDARGLVEAPRGTLGHWLRVEGGRILDYQIITPTSWNFSPRDGAGVAGPVESALAGVAAGDGADRSAVLLWVVRSFDPCLFCSVH